MLALPENGMNRSVSSHNINLGYFCDWIEANIVFGEDYLSKSNVVDILTENSLYSSQDFANEFVEQAWSIISQRMKYMGYPLGIGITRNRMTRSSVCETFPGYAFCMALACSELYPKKWASKWATSASAYGELFEELTVESLQLSYAEWTVRRVGWSPTNKGKLHATVGSIIADLNEIEGVDLKLHVNNYANELGLDVLAFRPYEDGHSSFPSLLVQCASGKNWKSKRHTPDLEIWTRIIGFNSRPTKGFAMPFTFPSPEDFRREAAPVNGLFIDRTRLLRPFLKSPSVSKALNKKLMAWTKKHIKTLPQLEVTV